MMVQVAAFCAIDGEGVIVVTDNKDESHKKGPLPVLPTFSQTIFKISLLQYSLRFKCLESNLV